MIADKRDKGPLNKAYNSIQLPSALHDQSKWALEQFHQVWPKMENLF